MLQLSSESKSAVKTVFIWFGKSNLLMNQEDIFSCETTLGFQEIMTKSPGDIHDFREITIFDNKILSVKEILTCSKKSPILPAYCSCSEL